MPKLAEQYQWISVICLTPRWWDFDQGTLRADSVGRQCCSTHQTPERDESKPQAGGISSVNMMKWFVSSCENQSSAPSFETLPTAFHLLSLLCYPFVSTSRRTDFDEKKQNRILLKITMINSMSINSGFFFFLHLGDRTACFYFLLQVEYAGTLSLGQSLSLDQRSKGTEWKPTWTETQIPTQLQEPHESFCCQSFALNTNCLYFFKLPLFQQWQWWWWCCQDLAWWGCRDELVEQLLFLLLQAGAGVHKLSEGRAGLNRWESRPQIHRCTSWWRC